MDATWNRMSPITMSATDIGQLCNAFMSHGYAETTAPSVAGPLSMAGFYDMGLARVSRPSGLGGYFGAGTLNVIPATNDAIRSSTGVEFQFILPVVSAPFRLIFAYNPQILDTTVMVGGRPLHIKEPRRDIKFTVGRSF